MIYIYFVILTIFFGGIDFYLINFALLPYDENNVLSIKNLGVVSFISVIFIALLFSLFHLVFDKLFFKKFFEKPNLFNAIRRGTLIGVFLIALCWLKIFDFFYAHIIAILFLIIVLVEILALSLKKKEENEEWNKND